MHMACIISVEARKEDEMKIEKTKGKEGKKGLRRNPSEYDKGKKTVGRIPVGQDDGDNGTTLGRKPATNSATADQYPGCTHVSSTQAQ
jgi:hypothetical protein